MIKIVVIAIIFFIATLQGQAQVGDVSKGSRGNKESSRGSDDSDKDSRRGGGGSGVFFFLDIFDFIHLIGQGQKDQLSKRFDEPYRVSLQAGFNGGYYNKEGTFSFIPSIRGNWGLISTHLRSNSIQDRTGQFQTLDWQVIQFNIVNIPEFTLRAGTGFSYVKDINDTYHESTIEFEGHIHERSINPFLYFRWSNDYNTNDVPRLEISPGVDFKIMQTGKFRVHATAAYLYQRYLGENVGDFVPFHFIQTGLNLYFY